MPLRMANGRELARALRFGGSRTSNSMSSVAAVVVAATGRKSRRQSSQPKIQSTGAVAVTALPRQGL